MPLTDSLRDDILASVPSLRAFAISLSGNALDKLPQDQREALILVGASGFSYEDAAAICGCAVGTIKSRVNRARSKLSALLYVEGAEDFGPDETVRAVIGGNGG